MHPAAYTCTKVGPSPSHAARAAAAAPPSALQYCFAAAPHPASRALFSTRQGALSFSQPLSFKTSKVTDMSYMFDVRSARAPGGSQL